MWRGLIFIVCSLICSIVQGQEIAATFYFKTNGFTTYQLLSGVAAQDAQQIDFELPTLMFFHGWMENIDADYYEYISDSYFVLQFCNIIFVDWSSYSQLDYISSAFMAQTVGIFVGAYLADLKTEGLVLKELHVVAHSLGSHVAGNACRKARELSGEQIYRISSLDPAGPLFLLFPYFFDTLVALKSTDAKIVDVLHTSLVLGAIKRIGTVDFYANTLVLSVQPGCDDIEICSHHRSYVYFNISIFSCGFRASDSFFGEYDTVYGENMVTSITGTYFFTTYARFPFAKGDPTCG